MSDLHVVARDSQLRRDGHVIGHHRQAGGAARAGMQELLCPGVVADRLASLTQIFSTVPLKSMPA
jgi:hypothetical protein